MIKIKFAVVGCGHIGKRHIETIKKNNAAELVAICDIQNREALNLIDVEDIPFFNSIENLIESKIPFDVLNICTPNGLHANHAMTALKNLYHVVIEKPMALNKVDCIEMIKLAEEKNKNIFCVMQNRYSPPAVWIKEIMAQKKLGEIYFVQMQCYWNRDERYYTKNTWHGNHKLDGGTLFTQFSHFIDLFIWLFGAIKISSAQFYNFNHTYLNNFEDSGNISFEFGKNSIGTMQYSTSVFEKNFESSITIIAEKGTVKIGGQYMDKVEYCNIKNYSFKQLEQTNAANEYGAYQGSAANHHFIIENVIQVLSNKAPISTTSAEGLAVVDAIESIYQFKL